MMTSAVEVPFVDLRAQFAGIREEIGTRVQEVLENTAYILGPEVREFEQELASFLGAKHAIGVANGTDALLLALKAVGIRTGDHVIIPSNTFVATAEAIAHLGGRPVLVDVNSQTYNIDTDQIERHITSRVRAIIPVHLYGQPADLDPIFEIAEKYGLHVIEDAAQAHGAEYKGHRVGPLGSAGCFSFYPAKNLGAYGDSGAVVTNNDQIAHTVRKLHDHGGIEKYQHDLVGYNSRLDTLHAAVLTVKLKYLDGWNRKRWENAQVYNRLLSGIPGVVIPAVLQGVKHVYHLYVIRTEGVSRDELRSYLQERGVQTAIHYPTPLHLTEAFAYLQYRENDFPVAEQCAKNVLSLPMYPELEERQIRYVAEHVRDYMRTYG